MADRLKGAFSPWLRRQRFAAVQRFIKTGQVIDYGCGIGLLANFVSPERYIGLDVDDLSLARARQEFPAHRFLRLSEFEPDIKFDTLIALAVIQYLPDPERFLRWALELLRPGGNVVITTPNPAAESLLLIGGRLGLLGKDSREEHLTLLDKSGFFSLAQRLAIPITEYSTFLLGLNQLAVYQIPAERQIARMHTEGLAHGS